MQVKPEKQDVMDEISEISGIPRYRATVGKSVPRAFFDDLLQRYGLGPEPRMVDCARSLVFAAGLRWPLTGDSTAKPSGGGGTVTLDGLLAMLAAVSELTNHATRVPSRAKPSVEPAARETQGVPFSVARPKRTQQPEPFTKDPDVLDAAQLAHYKTLVVMSEWLRRHGLHPLRPATDQPPYYDLAWEMSDSLWVVEVKSITARNEIHQFRLGIGQVLDYVTQLEGHPVLVLSAQPSSERLVRVSARAGVALTWPSHFRDRAPRDLFTN